MIKRFVHFSWVVAAIALSAFFTSCQKDDVNVTEDVEFFVNSTVYDLEERGNCGRHGCYEFVFPVTIEFPGGETASIESYDDLRTTLRDWKEANPDVSARPGFVFPLELMTEDGEIISVASQKELMELRMECRRDFFERKRHNRGRRHGEPCYKPVFPLTLSFPGGGEETYDDPEAMQAGLHAWKEANPGPQDERPMLVFPIKVESIADGAIIDVADLDALKALREECQAAEDD